MNDPALRKLIFYTHALAGGGAERVWALLASGFAQRGHDVIMAVDYESKDNLAFIDKKVRIEVLGGPHAQNVLRLSKLIRREKPDATLSALCVSNLKHAAAAALAGRSSRAILSYHGFFESEPQALSRTSYLLTPLLSRFTGRTIAVSESLAQDLRKRFFAKTRRTERIYNPAIWGEARTNLTEAELKARPPLVVACGRLSEDKDFRSLIRAFAKVQPQNARLVIVGEGSARASLQAEIDRLGLKQRVELAGYAPEPWSYYAQASCLAVSSKLESFGMVVVEALGHGLPIVSTDCKGPREILADGRFGRLVPVGDTAKMAGAISAALVDPGDPAPRIARASDFSLSRALDAYGSMIEDVAAAANRRKTPASLLAPIG
jgi:glycosyltransferase involved in cell wall biosynthesis